MDSLGHKYCPKSEKVINHIIKLDSYFKKIEKTFNDFYHDNKTTFIITADHGMDLCASSFLIIYISNISFKFP